MFPWASDVVLSSRLARYQEDAAPSLRLISLRLSLNCNPMAAKLCDMKKKLSLKRDRALVEACIRDPQFICRKCFRAANCPRLLCKPEKAFREAPAKCA